MSLPQTKRCKQTTLLQSNCNGGVPRRKMWKPLRNTDEKHFNWLSREWCHKLQNDVTCEVDLRDESMNDKGILPSETQNREKFYINSKGVRKDKNQKFNEFRINSESWQVCNQFKPLAYNLCPLILFKMLFCSVGGLLCWYLLFVSNLSL